MSDPVSNHDIEDVLSSIRRLVAQGDPRRVNPVADEAVSQEPEVPAIEENSVQTPRPDRLVLTPAFRVNTPPEPTEIQSPPSADIITTAMNAAANTSESAPIPSQDPDPIPAVSQSPSERASLEATIAQLEAAVSSRRDEWEPDGTELPAATGLTAAFASRHVDASAEEYEDEADSADVTETALNAIVADHVSDAISQQIAEAFPGATAADVPPQADDPAVVADTVVQLNPDRVQSRDHQPTALSIVPQRPAVDAEIDADVVASTRPTAVSAPTFHRTFREVYDPIAEATADAAEAAPDADAMYGDELAPDDTPEITTALAEPASSGALVDPEMLRDMVGQMIRQELQGEMGERITRNVRKLVRREINRVISSQEFD